MMVVHILTAMLFLYLVATIGYLLVLSLAGRLGKIATYSTHPTQARIAVMIPSYKEDNVIVATASNALLHDYPSDKFSVTVIADQLLPETILALKALPVNVVEPILEKSMKSRSLHAAFQQFPHLSYDLALILDADNIMSPGTLQKVNHAYQLGWKVIQCHRTAKNKNTSIAVLDALSEEINNTIFRRGQRALGLSCALIGSGMAFEYELIKEIFGLERIHHNPGEDKEIEILLLQKRLKVEYIGDAHVYDEKVQRSEVFQKQRTRWLATQIGNIRLFWANGMQHHFREKAYLHKFFQTLIMPRLLLVLLFGLIVIGCAIDAFTGAHFLLPTWKYWAAPVLLYTSALLIAVPPSFYDRRTLKALLKIPVLLFAVIKALFGIKKSRTQFIHTPKEFSG
jgi:cellulose synthase/poly-beta-1,6-N-acetylglucosamine synthase-like glycosyltransferase